MSDLSEPTAAGGVTVRSRLWLFLPLLGFVLIALLFLVRLGAGDASRIPSALINKPVPNFGLPPILEGQGPGLDDEALAKGVHVVNVWASWCAPCREEHPLLLRLSQDKRFSLVGIDYKDVPANGARFLGALGNPFARVGADRNGATAIDWGVYGVPETFVVKDGVIAYKFIGPLSEQGLRDELMPAVERALGQ